jgi:flagellin
MSSINTNLAAMTALQSLNKTMSSMQTTQSNISTGHRVDTASDNAAYWSIATTMRSDNSALSTVSDALSLGASTIDVATAGLNAAISVTSQIKSKLVAAAQPGVDRTKIQSEVKQLQTQLKSIADSAVFSGQNWLSVDSQTADASGNAYNGTKSIISSYSHDASNAVSVGTINVVVYDKTTNDTTNGTGTMALFDNKADGTGDGTTAHGILDSQDLTTNWKVAASGDTAARTDLQLTGSDAAVNSLDISAITDAGGDLQKLNAMTQMVDQSISRMTTAASNLGAGKARVTLQQSFVSSLKDSIDKGVGALVDADMNSESTKLQALQVQQQLGVQALSIANQSSQAILKLFG